MTEGMRMGQKLPEMKRKMEPKRGQNLGRIELFLVVEFLHDVVCLLLVMSA